MGISVIARPLLQESLPNKGFLGIQACLPPSLGELKLSQPIHAAKSDNDHGDGHRTFRFTELALWGLLALLLIVPFWAVRVHPLPDLSMHLAAASIWHNYSDPAFEFSRYYSLSMPAAPYWGYYTLTHLLAFPLGIDIANRVVLSLYALGLVGGAAALARCFGRDARLGLLAVPLVWNANLDVGFVPFLVGLVVALWALVAFDRFCWRPRLWLGFLTAALGASVYFCHLLPWGFYFACAGLIGLLHTPRTVRSLGGRILVWLAGVVPGAAITLTGAALNLSSTVRSGARFQVSRTAPADAIKLFYTFVFGPNPSLIEQAIVAVWVATCLLLLIRTFIASPLWRRKGIELRSEACLLVATTAYFVLPRSVISPTYWWGIHIRYAMVVCLFLPLCITGSILGWRRVVLLVGTMVSGLGMTTLTLHHWRSAEVFAAGYHELAAKLPMAARALFVLGYPRHHEGARQNYLQCYYAYHQALQGGYLPYTFDEGFPVKFRVRYPAPGWRAANFDWQRHARYYDYLFTFARPDVVVGHEKEVELLGQQGRWQLWKLKGPREDKPPFPPYPPHLE
jgi:hypothetical protein